MIRRTYRKTKKIKLHKHKTLKNKKQIGTGVFTSLIKSSYSFGKKTKVQLFGAPTTTNKIKCSISNAKYQIYIIFNKPITNKEKVFDKLIRQIRETFTSIKKIPTLDSLSYTIRDNTLSICITQDNINTYYQTSINSSHINKLINKIDKNPDIKEVIAIPY